jgi:hypothetical protein
MGEGCEDIGAKVTSAKSEFHHYTNSFDLHLLKNVARSPATKRSFGARKSMVMCVENGCCPLYVCCDVVLLGVHGTIHFFSLSSLYYYIFHSSAISFSCNNYLS